jgi:hypothetical protein
VPKAEIPPRTLQLPSPSKKTPPIPAVTKAAVGLQKLKLGFIILLLIFVLSELICRFVIGLGDPPLYQADAKIEYLLRPSKLYYRFHTRFSVNRYGMRADDFPPQKTDPNELRIIVFGDSVLYGGVRIDQTKISTEILKQNLQKRYGRPIVVGNASAKGWGPPNEVAYLKRYGTLDADIIILELSSHDYADALKFISVVGISSDFPDKKPLLALTDLFKTYLLPRYLHIGETPAGVDQSLESSPVSEDDIGQCRTAEHEFFAFARAHGAKVALIQHLTRPEFGGQYQPGYYANQTVAKEDKVAYVDDAEELRALMKLGDDPFYPGDPIPHNEKAQPLLAHTLQRAVDMASKTN